MTAELFVVNFQVRHPATGLASPAVPTQDLLAERSYTEVDPLYKNTLEVWTQTEYPEHPDVAETLTNSAPLCKK